MAPKFKGNSDDWLDDQKSIRRLRSAHLKKPGRLKEDIPAAEANGIVAEIFPKQCRVILDSGVEEACFYKRAQILGETEEGLRERSPVAVGDRVKVKVERQGSGGVVEGVCRRTSKLVRPAPDREQRSVHVIASNIEHLLVVGSVIMPDFSPGLVDRFLIAAEVGEIQPIICINKFDLLTDTNRTWSIYEDMGYEVFEISAKQKIGVERLSKRLSGKKTVFCGHSGVGKTSLIRALLGENIGKIGDVNFATGKGRHTTTGAVLLRAPENSIWIDTPGVREFGLAGVELQDLKNYFPEFVKHGCKIKDCLHYNEDGCAVKDEPRYQSYRRIFESLKSGGY